MDKTIIGKWQGNAFGEVINIISVTPLKIKISFNVTGYFNTTPNCVYEKNEYLCYEINDEYNRMIFHIKYNRGKLEGYYTFHEKNFDIVYEKISDIPDDKPFEYNPQMIIVPTTNKTRIQVLREYSDYDKNIKYNIVNTYSLNENIPEILRKYNYYNYVNDLKNTDDKIVFSLLNFVCNNFGHNGTNGLSTDRKISGIIEFCERNNQKTNCRGLAILLASLLRLNGIKAQHITCMPYEEPFEDCHVVVDCLLPSGKRIMLDPTYHLYYKDKNNEYVSLQHLREMLIAGDQLFPNKEASYNGEKFYEKYYIGYMTKNTFRFGRFTLAKDGVDWETKDSKYIELVPKFYNNKKLNEGLILNDEEFWKM